MSVITRMRKQTAVYWDRTGIDDSGQPTFATPVQISCRYVDSSEEFVGEGGERQVSSAVVYVDRSMSIGSMLLGRGDGSVTLAELASDSSPDVNNALPILGLSNTPNFKATETLRKVML